MPALLAPAVGNLQSMLDKWGFLVEIPARNRTT
jgi:hypothetical protein